MKLRLPAAIVMSLALPAFALPAAAAPVDAPSPFRSVEAQTFSASDLQRYGLTDAQIAEVQAYQAAGYDVQVMSPEEAEEYTAGISTNNFLAIVGLVAIIVVIVSVL